PKLYNADSAMSCRAAAGPCFVPCMAAALRPTGRTLTSRRRRDSRDRHDRARPTDIDRKSTRLNSSHLVISYAVFCLKKKNHESLAHADGHVEGAVVDAHPRRVDAPALEPVARAMPYLALALHAGVQPDGLLALRADR